MHLRRTSRVVLALAAGTAAIAGCSSAQEPDVRRVASAFEDPSSNPEERCDLLLPATRAAFEHSESAPCSEAVQNLSLRGGSVESVEIWGGDAQVRLTGDTVFLTETSAGWRIASAVCRPQGEAPYDCEVDRP